MNGKQSRFEYWNVIALVVLSGVAAGLIYSSSDQAKKAKQTLDITSPMQQQKPVQVEMRSEVLIPVVPAAADPEWLINKHAGRALSPSEKRLVAQYKHEKEHQQLQQNLSAPTSETIS